MSCQRCTDLCVTYPIRSPSEMRKAISVAGDNLRDGTIEDISIESATFEPKVPFLSVLNGAPPGDYVAYRFRCTSCGEVFALTAETYHGSGGSWQAERSEANHVAT